MLPSRILLGLGSWVLTVPCTETLILGCTHLLVINSNRMTATRCGSSLSLSPPTSARGPGLTKTQMQRSITDLQNLHGRSWVLTVPCTETLILGCIHLLVTNCNRMTATRCGSSLSLSSPHQCPGPWPDENADAKKHHTPAKLSWSVGGAHGK